MPGGKGKLSDIIAEIWDRVNHISQPRRTRRLRYWQYLTNNFKVTETVATAADVTDNNWGPDANEGTWGESVWG
jgi:hypothetical protein